MQKITGSVLKQLVRLDPASHKGQNGRLLIIAGSEKYHGALLLAVQVASRIVDIVYVYTGENNRALVKKLKSEITVWINIERDDLDATIANVDAIVIGPGLSEYDDTILLVNDLVAAYNKKMVIDATALWVLDVGQLLKSNPRFRLGLRKIKNLTLVSSSGREKSKILTPHTREFEHLFNCDATGDNTLAMAREYNCIIALKGAIDYISDGEELYENHTGNVGMTKGGTGDVLAGLVGALATQNDALTAALAGAYLNGLAGDRLYEKAGTFYNAEDIVAELGKVWKENSPGSLTGFCA